MAHGPTAKRSERIFKRSVPCSLSLTHLSSSLSLFLTSLPPSPFLFLFLFCSPSLVFSPFSDPFLPLWLFCLSLLVPRCLPLFLAFSSPLFSPSPCDTCIRTTRGVIIVKPFSVPWHKSTTRDSQHKNFWRTKCSDEHLKSSTVVNKMFVYALCLVPRFVMLHAEFEFIINCF